MVQPPAGFGTCGRFHAWAEPKMVEDGLLCISQSSLGAKTAQTYSLDHTAFPPYLSAVAYPACAIPMGQAANALLPRPYLSSQNTG